GYEEGGQLTEKVRRRPYSVLLLDEIEKAHPDVFNLLLQIFDDGRLTDSQGRTVNFKNTIIIMTSNIGQEYIQEYSLRGKTKLDSALKERLLLEVKRFFRPEFLNRIDEIIIFNPLGRDDIRKIIQIEIEPIFNKLKERNISLTLSENFKEFLVEKGYDPNLGARPLKRAIQKYLINQLSFKLLEGEIKEGKNVLVDLDKDNKPVFILK
ncbi:MAG: AAA family ATPase, partial [Candidatus Omnitrophica bacterium]|nr:AAA family ATPase [Candidatus Omnitrophota bacterium]